MTDANVAGPPAPGDLSKQGEILGRTRPLVHRTSVIDPMPQDHRVHLPVGPVVATRLD
jgi:hypothetical protein